MQPQAYNRETDFTERTGDDTDNGAINTELDAAAISINQIRDNLELIQGDDGKLASGIVDPDSLDDSVYQEIGAKINVYVVDAQTAATSANNAAVSANVARDAAISAKNISEASKIASLLNANSALQSAVQANVSATSAENNKNIASSQAATASSNASAASASASNALESATRSESAAQSALAIYGGISDINNAVATAAVKASEASASALNAAASEENSANSEAVAVTKAGEAFDSATASQIGADTAYQSAIQAGLSLNAIQAIISLTAANAAYSLLGSSIMKTGSIFATAEYGILENTTLSNNTTSAAIYVKDPATGVRIQTPQISVSNVGSATKTFTAVYGAAFVIGSRSIDNVYVVSGSDADLTALGSQSDVIYLTGAWAEYAKTYTGETVTFSRILGDGILERVKVGAMNSSSGNEKLVFSDGSVLSYNARSAVVANPICAITDIAGYDATTTTPSAPPSDFLYIDTLTPSGVLKCDGTAISRSAYPALFARIGTSFGVGDGVTTFNLPNIPPVAAGIPYYIKA